ncbi:MAG: GTP 3',8-cyclase MoaA [Armatimonadota bacterium]|nr:GTP 3',8-cyclase MoaA [Armatimonadota bacterium]
MEACRGNGRITYMRLSITDRCDLQCRYCAPYRNSTGRTATPLSVDEIAALVRAFAGNGVSKVRVTGGEPLVRPDVVGIVELLTRTAGVDTVGLTTNAVRLEEMAAPLARAGLRSVNISLDSLDRETFRRITGSDSLAAALRGLDAALRAFEKVKINTVVMRGVNDGEVLAIADLARRLPVEARFIELMPLGHTAREWESMFVSAGEIRQMLGDVEPLPRPPGSSARVFAIRGAGRVGIISPMSDDFCAECNRVRVTASGRFKPCLRLPDERDVRSLLRESDPAASARELMAWAQRHKLSGPTQFAAVQAEGMCSVGG